MTALREPIHRRLRLGPLSAGCALPLAASAATTPPYTPAETQA